MLFRHLRLWCMVAVIPVVLFLLSCHGFFTNPVLTSINVSPSNPSVVVGSTQQFTATGVNDDGSRASVTVTWMSSSTGIASVKTSGLATAQAVGSTTITATSTKSASITGTTIMTVTSTAITAITISDTTNGTISTIGGTDQFHATATFADGSTKDITNTATWTSSNTGVATITSPGGLATGVAAGTAQITASSGNVTSSGFTLTVL